MRANASSTSPPGHQALLANAEGAGFLGLVTSLSKAAAFLVEEVAILQRRPNEAGSKTLGVWLFGLQVVWRRSTPTLAVSLHASVGPTRHAMERSIAMPGDLGCDQLGWPATAADQIGRVSAPRC